MSVPGTDLGATLVGWVEECFECAVLSVACAETSLNDDQLRVLALLGRSRFDGASLCLAAGRLTALELGLAGPRDREFLLVCGAIRITAALCEICVDGHWRHLRRAEDCASCRAALGRCRCTAQRIAVLVDDEGETRA